MQQNFVTWPPMKFDGNQDVTRYKIADIDGDGKQDIVYIGAAVIDYPGYSVRDVKVTARIQAARASSDGLMSPETWHDGLGDGFPYQYWITDINGDGKSDLYFLKYVLTVGNTSSGFFVDTACISNGSKFTGCQNVDSSSERSILPGAEQLYKDITSATVFADFSGDSSKDIIHIRNDSQLRVNTSINTVDSFSFSGYAPWATLGNGDPSKYFFADFDGDSSTDVAYMSDNGSTDSSVKATFSIKLNTGGNYSNFTMGDAKNGAYRIADCNGDGKPDLLWINSVDGSLFAALSTGNSLVGANGETNFANSAKFGWGQFGNGDVTRYLVGDFNSDGKADLLWIEQSTGNLFIALSNGSRFTAANGVTDWNGGKDAFLWGQLGNGDPSRYKIGDFNGDGKSDLMYVDTDGYIHILLSAFNTNILLSHIDTRQGGTIDIGFSPAIDFFTDKKSPIPFQVVTSVTANDYNPLKQSQGISSTSTHTISYSGGYYSSSQRELRGFSQVTVDGPSGPNGERGTVTMWFHQGDTRLANLVNDASVADAFMRGKPYRIRTSDVSGSGYVERVINYVDTTQSPHFNPPSDITVSECKDSTTCRISVTTYTYDSYGNVTRQEVQPDLNDSIYNKTVDRAFDPNTAAWIVSLPSSETVYKGIGASKTQKAKTEYFYDAAASCAVSSYITVPQQGKVTGIRYWLQDGTSPEVRMAYDGYGNKICDRDAGVYTNSSDIRFNTTTYVYDPAFNYYLKEIKPSNNKIPSTKFTYYGVDATGNGLYGQLKDTTDANGKKTTIQYDQFGRQTRTDYPDLSWGGITYTDHSATAGIGVQNIITDNSAGLWEKSYFDGMNKIFTVESSGPDGKTIVNDTVFDARNNPYMTSFPYFKNQDTRIWGATVTRDYLGRVTRTVKPGETGNVTVQNCYDLRIVATLDENGHLKKKIINGLGLVAEVGEYTGKYTDCSSASPTLYADTTYVYDVMGRLTRVTDTKHNIIDITYDSLGRKQTISDSDMGSWSYTYHPNGLLKTTTDAKHQTITYSYDELNRTASKKYPSGPDVVYTYDEDTSSNPKGRLTRMADASGHTVYNYDSMGRIVGITKTIDGIDYPPLVFGYLNGRLDSITYPDEKVSYGYNGPNLKSVGNYISYTNIDALGRPWNAAYGTGGASTSLTYAPATKRLSTLSVHSPTQGMLVDNSYGYYDKGNIKSITDNLNITLPIDMVSRTYFNDPDRAHAVGSTGSGLVFQYDDNGNLTNDGKRVITYNYDNMPVTVNNASFSYDGNGMRLKKTVGNKTTAYIDKLYECTNGVCIKYIFAGSTRIASNNNGLKLYYHPDHLGSTAVVTNATGEKEERISYYPFGEKRKDENDVIDLKHKYTGQEWDDEIELYNFNARLYDPDLGRFITPDSIVPEPGNPQSLNRFAYALNNPINLIDPTGHYSFASEGNLNSATVDSINIGANLWNATNTAWESGNYGTAALNAGLWFLNGAINLPVSFAFDMSIGPAYNTGFKYGQGLMQLDSNKLLTASFELLTLGLGAKFMSPGVVSTETASATAEAISWNPANGPGPLGKNVASTFRSSTYTERVTTEVESLYRTYGGTANEIGAYWTKTPPAGPLQSTIDSALNPAWGNTANNVANILVPPGTRLFEGYAAAQGNLVGGGNQIFMLNVNPAWLVK